MARRTLNHTTSRKRKELSRGFPPIAADSARVLVLGSMPSLASLAKREYYGHPRNAFWPIMGRLLGAGPQLTYPERQRILRARGVAVWDVLRECRRAGSLDAAIDSASETPNDLVTFLRKHPRIGTIFFNGQKAEAAFRRHVLPLVETWQRPFRYALLPSTSPAHAGCSFPEKLAAWHAVLLAIQCQQAPQRRRGSGAARGRAGASVSLR